MSQSAAVRAEPLDGIKPEQAKRHAVITVLWVALSFVIASFAAALIAHGLFTFTAGIGTTLDPNVLNGLASAAVFAILLLIVLGVPKVFKLWSGRISYRRLLGFTRPMWWRDIGYAAVAFVVYFAFWFVASWVASYIPGFNPDQAQDTGFSHSLSSANAIVVFVSLVIIPPIVEEIVFRGYLFGTLRRSIRVVPAALITSALFGLAHLQWNVGLDVFLMSLTSCFLRYKTGALWASILLHMLKNGVAFYFLYIATQSIL